ncbi:MAG: NAD(P)H-quinone oxidoreductase [Actinomycetales bacterium]|nr:NAD(P)H-quinone oxidoreductase [Actinomycetales bacterium]
MKAVVITAPGPADVLRVEEVPDPVAGRGQVVLEVAATAVNRADLLQRRGLYPPPAGAPPWPGLEASGTVAEVGEGVTGWSAGDRACALLPGGGYAERVAVAADQLLPVPGPVGLVEAAALPEVVCTVWSNVFMLAGLRPGEVLLVHGGAGGIGTMAIQLGRAVGARVAVTAGSAEKLSRCAELGAEIGVNYREQDFVAEVLTATSGHGADVVLDTIGAKYLARNVEVLAVNGRLVVIGLQGGRRAELDLAALLEKRGALLATSLRARPDGEKAAIVTSVREHVWPLLERGEVRPVIHSVLPLAEAAEAHRLVEGLGHVGKVLLTP